MSEGERPALLTRWVGPRSTADLPVPLAPERAVALTLAVAATVGPPPPGRHRARPPRPHPRAARRRRTTRPVRLRRRRPDRCAGAAAGDRSGPGWPLPRPGPHGGRPTTWPAWAGCSTTCSARPDRLRPGGRLTRSHRGPPAQRRALRALAAGATVTRPRCPAVGDRVRPRAAASGPRGPAGRRPRRPPVAPRPSRSTSPVGPPRPTDRRPARRRAPRPDPTSRRGGGARVRSVVPAALVLVAVSAASYFGLSAWWAPGATARPSPTRPPRDGHHDLGADHDAAHHAPRAPTSTPRRRRGRPGRRPRRPALRRRRPRRRRGRRALALRRRRPPRRAPPRRRHGPPVPPSGRRPAARSRPPRWPPSRAPTGSPAAELQAGCADLIVTGAGRDLTILTTEDLR